MNQFFMLKQPEVDTKTGEVLVCMLNTFPPKSRIMADGMFALLTVGSSPQVCLVLGIDDPA